MRCCSGALDAYCFVFIKRQRLKRQALVYAECHELARSLVRVAEGKSLTCAVVSAVGSVYETAGCGIRRILDLYYLKTKLGDSIDSEYIDSVLEKYDFTENAHKLITLSKFWFERIEPDIDLTDTIIDVLRSGNHGTTDIKLRNDLYRDAADSLSKAKRRKVKDFLFPPKEVLLEGYPELEGKDYSLFAMRLYRIKKNFTPKCCICYQNVQRYIRS